MRDRNIQRMVKRGEITHAEGERLAAVKATKSALPTKEEPIDFCNAERYADPTAYYAMQNIVRKQREAARSQLRTYPRTRVARYI